MRIVFMGTSDFSVPILQSLGDAGHEIVAVYCQPPRPAGRGKKERLSPVQKYAQDLGLLIRTPLNFKDETTINDFSKLNADIAVVVAYGLILPEEILEAPKNGCLNIHASLLPRWRGAAPIHRAILAGDKTTGICIMKMEKGLDTGSILLRDSVEIILTDTTKILHDRLALLGSELILEALSKLKKLTPRAQSEDNITYAKKISKNEAEIDWNKSALEVDRHIRGLSPFPGAWFVQNNQRIKVLMSKATLSNGVSGQVLDDNLEIACKSGAVRLLRLQRAGKGAMDANEFLRGFSIQKGQCLSFQK